MGIEGNWAENQANTTKENWIEKMISFLAEMEKDLSIALDMWFMDNPRQYLQDILDIEEFENLEKFVEDTKGAISWENLAEKGVVKVKWKIIEWIYWKRDLDLRWSSIKSLWKLKKVKWTLDCSFIEPLEDIWKLEKVWWNLLVDGTSSKIQLEVLERLKINRFNILKNIIKKTKFKRLKVEKHTVFWWKKWIDELLNQKKIPWYLLLHLLPIDKQIKVINRLKTWKLKLKGKSLFGWDIEWIEKLLKLKVIPWGLYLRRCPFSIQIETLYKILRWELKVEDFELDDWIFKKFLELYQDSRLNLEKFSEIFGEDINKLEDEWQREYAKKILIRDYERKKIEIKQKIEELANKNRGKSLTEEEKKNLREKVLEFDRELNIYRERIEGFGVKI